MENSCRVDEWKGSLTISYIIILFTGLIIATILDVTKRRIPNWLTAAMAIIGLMHSLLKDGWGTLTEHLIAMLLGFVLFFIFYLIRAFGAGDVKLMAALGAVMGYPFILYVSIASVIAGGCLSFFQLLWKNGIKRVIFFIYYSMKTLLTGRLKEFNRSIRGKETSPFSIAILAGSVTTLWLMYQN